MTWLKQVPLRIVASDEWPIDQVALVSRERPDFRCSCGNATGYQIVMLGGDKYDLCAACYAWWKL